MARELSKVYKVPLYEVNYSPTSGEKAKLEYVESIIVIKGLLWVEELLTKYKDFTVLQDRFFEKCNVGEGYKLNNYGMSVAGVSRSAHLVVLSRDFNDMNYVSGDEVDNYLAASSQNKWVRLYEDKYSTKKTGKVFKK
jgi:hypothetical protein